MSEISIVTIDGPAASGKTSVSRGLAQHLGWDWVSTGAFYRGLAYVALAKQVDLQDEKALADLCLSPDWNIQMTMEQTLVFLNGKDVTLEIFKEETGNAASIVSQYPSVRKNLLAAQRECVSLAKLGLVAEGRDCGTIVFPQARVKIYLTASQDSRAKRRAEEKGDNLETTLAAQKQRDAQDSSRKIAPMQAAKEAHIVDTSQMSLEEVVEHIYQIVQNTLSSQ